MMKILNIKFYDEKFKWNFFFITMCTKHEQIYTVNWQALIFCAKKLGHWMKAGWMVKLG